MPAGQRQLADRFLLQASSRGADASHAALGQELQAPELEMMLGDAPSRHWRSRSGGAQVGSQVPLPAVDAVPVGGRPKIAVGTPAGGAALPFILAQDAERVSSRSDQQIDRMQRPARSSPAGRRSADRRGDPRPVHPLPRGPGQENSRRL